MKPKYLVVDTAAFVKNVPIWDFGEEILSVGEIVNEIRDRQTRDRLHSLPVPINFKQPQPHSIKFVNEFSKKTGDYASLSLADIKLLALTYELEVEAKGGSGHLRSEPQKIVTQWGNKSNNRNSQPDVTETSEQNCGTPSSGESLSDIKYDSSFTTLQNHEETEISIREKAISLQHLKELDSFLSEYSYASGYVLTAADMIIHRVILQEYPQFDSLNHTLSGITNENNRPVNFPPSASFPHLQRWAAHISSFAEEELTLLNSSSQILPEFLQRFPDGDIVGDCKESSDALGETAENECNPDIESENIVSDHDEGVECGQEHDTSEEEQQFGDVVDDEENDGEGPTETSDKESEEESDDEGWITPSNIKRHKLKSGFLPEEEEEEEDALVACMTSDFAMQNVLKHIGLSVMGVDGKLIRRIKNFILRCHACYKTTSDMTKIFCPTCGNKTLKKVSVTVNPDGSQHIWISARRRISTRGMKYSLPTPKGGKHGRNPLLVADQREAKHFSSKMSSKKVNPLHQDYDPDHLPFAVRDVYSRAAQLGYIGGKDHHHYYWEKRNPNEPKRKTGKKKK